MSQRPVEPPSNRTRADQLADQQKTPGRVWVNPAGRRVRRLFRSSCGQEQIDEPSAVAQAEACAACVPGASAACSAASCLPGLGTAKSSRKATRASPANVQSATWKLLANATDRVCVVDWATVAAAAGSAVSGRRLLQLAGTTSGSFSLTWSTAHCLAVAVIASACCGE